MFFSDHSPINLEFQTSRLREENTKTYCETCFLKSILSVDSFSQEISKSMQTINYSESLIDCFRQFEPKYHSVLDNFTPFGSSSFKKKRQFSMDR